MFVKVFIVATLLCTLQCSVEVESFEFIKNAFKNVASKVHNIIHPNHVHDANCKHNHEENTVSSTTPYPEIDIRRGGIIAKPITSDTADKIVFPDEATTTAIPNIKDRTLIGAPCPSGSRSVNGQCRTVVG